MFSYNRAPLFIVCMAIFTLPHALQAQGLVADVSWPSASNEPTKSNNMLPRVTFEETITPSSSPSTVNNVAAQSEVLKDLMIAAFSPYAEKLTATQAALAKTQDELAAAQSMIAVTSEENQLLAKQLKTYQERLCNHYEELITNTSFWDYFSAKLFGISPNSVDETQQWKKPRGTRVN